MLTLKVTPQITEAGTVILTLEVENNAADFANRVNGIPPINTQSAKTQLLVRDGATAVVGGIYQSNEQTAQARTPFLGSVPILGYLFRNRSVTSTNNELLALHHSSHPEGIEGSPMNRMGGRRTKMASWRSAMRAFALVAVAGLLAVGCTPDWVKQNDSPVLFLISDINGGNVLSSDVSAGGLTITDSVGVTMVVRPKNHQFSTVPQIPMDVFVDQYSVKFVRTDGHNVEGVDVPFHFSGALRTSINVALSGEATTIGVPLVRASAKQEPPLRNFRAIFPTTNTSPVTGRPVIQMIAEITVYAHTIAQEAISDTGRVVVEFSDQ